MLRFVRLMVPVSYTHLTNSWLNDLKLRASYGTQGNESILSEYDYAYVYTPYQDQYTVTSVSYTHLDVYKRQYEWRYVRNLNFQ